MKSLDIKVQVFFCLNISYWKTVIGIFLTTIALYDK